MFSRSAIKDFAHRIELYEETERQLVALKDISSDEKFGILDGDDRQVCIASHEEVVALLQDRLRRYQKTLAASGVDVLSKE